MKEKNCFYCSGGFAEDVIGEDKWGDKICPGCQNKYFPEDGRSPQKLPWCIETANEGGLLKVNYVPLPSMQRFHDSPAYHRCIVGPRGSGKTSTAIMEKIRIGTKHYPKIPKTSFLILRSIYEDLKKSTRKTFFQHFPPDKKVVFYNDNEKTAIILLPPTAPPTGYKTGAGAPGGMIEFVFSAAERPEEYSKFLSGEYTGVLIDEAVQFPREVRDQLVGCIRYPLGFPPEDFHLDGITNPPDSEEHWLWQSFYPESPKRQPNHTLIINPPFENKPLLQAHPLFYVNLLETMSPDMARIYVWGLVGYIQKGDPFYPWFSRDVHEFDKTGIEYSPYGRLLRGWDFGARASCVIFVYEDDHGNLDIIHELLLPRTRGATERLAQEVIKHTNRFYPELVCEDFCDPAGKSLQSAATRTDIEILIPYGIIPRSRQSTYQERSTIMYHLLTHNDPEYDRRPYLRVDKSCVNIIRGFLGGYRHDKRKETVVRQKLAPVREGHYEHVFNALEYIAVGRYGGSMQDLVYHRRRTWKDDEDEEFFDDYTPVSKQWGYLGR